MQKRFEENIKQKGDNPTIGLVLCTEKNEAMAHYSVLKDSKHQSTHAIAL